MGVALASNPLIKYPRKSGKTAVPNAVNSLGYVEEEKALPLQIKKLVGITLAYHIKIPPTGKIFKLSAYSFVINYLFSLIVTPLLYPIFLLATIGSRLVNSSVNIYNCGSK